MFFSNYANSSLSQFDQTEFGGNEKTIERDQEQCNDYE